MRFANERDHEMIFRNKAIKKYHIGERKFSHRKLYMALLILVILVLAAAAVAHQYLKPNTQVGKTPPVITRKISYDTQKVVRFDETLFSISVPADWKPSTNGDSPKPDYIWQGTGKNDTTRWLDVYVDRDLSTFAVNRALSIKSTGRGVDVTGEISDNCTTLVNAAAGQKTGVVAGKWQNINFLCDVGNYERNVVGAISPDGMNTVTVKSSTGAVHHFFFVYTESSFQTDYTYFTNALKSFQMK